MKKNAAAGSGTGVLIGGLRYLFFAVYMALLAGFVFWNWSLWTQKNKQESSLQSRHEFFEVLPPFDNQPWSESFKIQSKTIYPAKKFWTDSLTWALPGVKIPRQTVGFAIESELVREARTRILVGVSAEGVLTGVAVEEEKKTMFAPAVWQEIPTPDFRGLHLGNWQKKVSTELWSKAPKDILQEAHQALFFFKAYRPVFFEMAGVIKPETISVSQEPAKDI